MELIENTASASSGRNHTLYEVCGDRTGGLNCNGQGGGKATTHSERDRGVGEPGVKWKWSKEDIDDSTHLTEQIYSTGRYERFSLVEHQRVWQNKNVRTKYAAPQTVKHTRRD